MMKINRKQDSTRSRAAKTKTCARRQIRRAKLAQAGGSAR